jgi:uncharacterized Zn finger protein
MTVSSPAINTQLGDEGLGQQPWWVEQWMELIHGYRFKKRLERAWEYARSGNVTSIRFEGRRVHARVQGAIKPDLSISEKDLNEIAMIEIRIAARR